MSTETIHDNEINLKDFEVTSILANHSKSKTIFILGRFRNRPSDDAILILEKIAFDSSDFEGVNQKILFEANNSLDKIIANDIYGNYSLKTDSDLNRIKTTLICPATQKHIEKLQEKTHYLIEETPEIYKEITLKYLEEEQFSLEWVNNILERKSEVENFVYEDFDPEIGFTLTCDLKWDQKTLSTLYLLAIVRKKDIRSLRDLTTSHLPLLRNIKDKGTKAIEDKYGINSSQLRIYLHYQPSFYHLHVHFTYLNYEAPGILVERAHLLTTVIDNIELYPDYYQRAKLSYTVKENDQFFRRFQSKNILKKINKDLNK